MMLHRRLPFFKLTPATQVLCRSCSTKFKFNTHTQAADNGKSNGREVKLEKIISTKSDGDIAAYKEKWAMKVADIELNNPVRLKQPPQLFADSIEYNQDHYRRPYNDRNKSKYSHQQERSNAGYYGFNDSDYASRFDDENSYQPNMRPRTHNTERSHGYHASTRRHSRTQNTSDYIDDFHIGEGYSGKSLILKALERERIKSLRNARGKEEQFGDLNSESQMQMDRIVGSAGESESSVAADEHYIRLAKRDQSEVYFYEVKLEGLMKKKRIAEAFELFKTMMEVKRIRPSVFMYACLISGFANQGDLHQVMKLYNQMKKMGIEPNEKIYTSLFHACSKAKDKAKGLQQANSILGMIRLRSYEMNHFNYKAAIKCFGILGDLEKAFALADEIPRENRYDSDTLSALLIACASDVDSGFQVALAMWRSMRKRNKVTLSSVHYNLLLRCLVNCNTGSKASLRQLIQEDFTRSTKSIDEGSMEALPPLQSSHVDVHPSADLTEQNLPTNSCQVADYVTKTSQSTAHREEDVLSDCVLRTSQSNSTTDENFQSGSADHLVACSHHTVREHDLPEEINSDDSELGELVFGEKSISEDCDDSIIESKSETSSSDEKEEVKYVSLVDKSNIIQLVDVSHNESNGVYGQITDILNPKKKLSKTIFIGSTKSPTSRLILLGGIQAVLRRMEVHRCQPDIKTFFYLLKALPYEKKAENRLMDIMEEMGVEKDLEFYTYVLLRRALRKRYKSMQPIIREIAERNLTPNHRLFSVLAMSCTSKEKCQQLLSDMESHSVQPDLLTFKSLILHAKALDLEYQTLILDTLIKFNIQPDTEFIRITSGRLRYTKNLLVQQEKGIETGKPSIDSQSLREYEQKFHKFLSISKGASTGQSEASMQHSTNTTVDSDSMINPGSEKLMTATY